jgi:hypothetical protein
VPQTCGRGLSVLGGGNGAWLAGGGSGLVVWAVATARPVSVGQRQQLTDVLTSAATRTARAADWCGERDHVARVGLCGHDQHVQLNQLAAAAHSGLECEERVLWRLDEVQRVGMLHTPGRTEAHGQSMAGGLPWTKDGARQTRTLLATPLRQQGV